MSAGMQMGRAPAYGYGYAPGYAPVRGYRSAPVYGAPAYDDFE